MAPAIGRPALDNGSCGSIPGDWVALPPQNIHYPQNLSKSDCRWYDLILQCRTSGLSDRQWLEENNVSSPTFYYHLKQLRKKACEIPASTFSSTSTKQDIVPLMIEEAPVHTHNADIQNIVSS